MGSFSLVKTKIEYIKNVTCDDWYDSTCNYLPSINGLRAVCISMVFAVHGGISYVGGGSIGVDIFFVLSGFLITQKILREMRVHQSMNLAGFYSNRSVRLFPALILMCTSMFFIFTWKFSFATALKEIIPSITYVADFSRSRFGEPSLLAHQWSLSIEEQFYLVWPLIIYLSFRFNSSINCLRMVIITLVCFICGWRALLYLNNADPTRIYDGIDCHSDGILIGCGLATLSSRMISWVGRFWHAAAVILVLWTVFGSTQSSILYFGGFSLISACAAIVIAVIVSKKDELPSQILQHQFLQRLGSISYGAYLWHFPIFILFQINGDSPQLSFVKGAPLSIIIATASFHFVEIPLIRMHKYATKNIKLYIAYLGPIMFALGLFYIAALNRGFRF